MTIIVVENVEVSNSETEIIEPQKTPYYDRDRIFTVANGDNEVALKAWGRHEENDPWVEKDSITLTSDHAGTLTVGLDVYWVKLTGKTTTDDPTVTTEVDACLVY